MALRSCTMRPQCRPAFRNARPCPVRVPISGQRNAVLVRAAEEMVGIRQWPDPTFIKETLEAFPDQGLANVEEARALFSNGGYVYLDVRSQLECEEVGKVKGSVNVPFVNIKRVFDPETKAKVLKKENNPDFVKQVERKFPNKEAVKLMVACSNGKAYSIDALELLEEAGYANLCFIRGGYNAWFRTWDNKLNRRRTGEYAEKYDGMGSDSCGIHASGAGFDKVDKADRWSLPVY